MTTMFNKMELKNKFYDYDINYKYYQQAIEKEVNNILGFTSNQLNLFD